MRTNKVLVLGAAGMLGHKLFTLLSERGNLDVDATVRSIEEGRWFSQELLANIHENVDADDFDTITRAIADLKPDVVINCIGIIKQMSAAQDPIISISINALFPHRLALACKAADVRMIHISTDCVFDGAKGNYSENDQSNATDLYGRTKFLGEVYYPHCLTLRTSIIGHELKGKHGLIEWFLAQKGKVRGFTNAIYSGFPTVEIARIISEYVITNADLKGLYHVSSNSISKYDLLKLVSERYKKSIEVEPYHDFRSDRSLDSTLFQRVTGYSPPSWPELIDNMYQDFIGSPYYKDKEKSYLQGAD
jgi:dTDP-4-dehydrorhamnose reductase